MVVRFMNSVDVGAVWWCKYAQMDLRDIKTEILGGGVNVVASPCFVCHVSQYPNAIPPSLIQAPNPYMHTLTRCYGLVRVYRSAFSTDTT